jgi:hypothetical protein
MLTGAFGLELDDADIAELLVRGPPAPRSGVSLAPLEPTAAPRGLQRLPQVLVLQTAADP